MSKNRLKEQTPATYSKEAHQLFNIGQQTVLALNPHILEKTYTSKILQATPSYTTHNERVTVELSPSAPFEGKLPQRLFSPILPRTVFQSESPTLDSEVTHSDQMHVDALHLSLLGILSGELAVDQTISDNLLRRASALLFGEASIAHFAVDSNINYAYSALFNEGQKYVDAGKLDHYVLSARSFYLILAERGVPTVDVHDLVHHALQFRTWPEFFLGLYNIAYLVNTDLTNFDVQNRTELSMLKNMISFISFATAEYSVVGENPRDSYSFGCLLYQYPRKSPMKKVNLLSENVTPRELTDWNSLRALMSLKRRDIENDYHFRGTKQKNWFENLGYSLPQEYWPTVDKNGKTTAEPVSQLERSHQINFDDLSFPHNPKQLFANSCDLLEKQVGVTTNLKPETKQQIEEWLHIMQTIRKP